MNKSTVELNFCQASDGLENSRKIHRKIQFSFSSQKASTELEDSKSFSPLLLDVPTLTETETETETIIRVLAIELGSALSIFVFFISV
jgi:hypothetical protein